MILLAVVQVALCYITVLLSRYAIYERRRSISKTEPLFDVVHDALDLTPRGVQLTRGAANCLQTALIATGAIILIGRRDLVEGFVRVLTVGYSIRALFVVLTIVPPPTEDCEFHRRLTVHGQCSDLYISGHQMVNVVICLGLLKLGRISIRTAAALSLLSGLLIVAGRNHYTVDVMAGALLAEACVRNLL